MPISFLIASFECEPLITLHITSTLKSLRIVSGNDSSGSAFSSILRNMLMAFLHSQTIGTNGLEVIRIESFHQLIVKLFGPPVKKISIQIWFSIFLLTDFKVRIKAF